MYDPYKEFTKHTLSNGVEIYSTYWNRPWIAAEIIVHSGAQEDPVHLPGLAHFVEHVATRNIPGWDIKQAHDFFDMCGGNADFGSTGYKSITYTFKIPTDSNLLETSLGIFGSLLFESTLAKEIEHERTVIGQEFKERYPLDLFLKIDMEIQKHLFKGHPRLETYMRPIGLPEGFLKAQQRDLQNFYDVHYVPKNVSIVFVGGFQKEELYDALIKSPFSTKKNGERNPLSKEWSIPKAKTYEKNISISEHLNQQVDQTKYFAKWTLPFSIKGEVLKIFSNMLNYFLFEEIREKQGLVYSITADYHDYGDVYIYTIQCNFKSETATRIYDLIEHCICIIPESFDLFEMMRKKEIQRPEMADLSGRALCSSVADELISFHRIITTEEYLDDLKKISMDDIKTIVSFLTKERRHSLIFCP